MSRRARILSADDPVDMGDLAEDEVKFLDDDAVLAPRLEDTKFTDLQLGRISFKEREIQSEAARIAKRRGDRAHILRAYSDFIRLNEIRRERGLSLWTDFDDWLGDA